MAALPPRLSFLPEGGGQRRAWGAHEQGPGALTLPPLWRAGLEQTDAMCR